MPTKKLSDVLRFPIKLSKRSASKSKRPGIKYTRHIKFLYLAESLDEVLLLGFEFKHGDKRKRRFFRLDDVSLHSHQFIALNFAGARLFSPVAKAEFITRIQAFKEDGKRRKVATRLGWHGTSFVLPMHTFGPDHTALLVHLDDPQSERYTRFRVGGTMEGWKELIVLAAGNTRLMLFLAAGFSGPVAALLGVEQVGLMLVGDPVSGKTTILIAVGSIWGCHIDQNKANEVGFAQTFNATDNSLEDDHLAANHTAVLLDETRTKGASDREIGATFGGVVMRLSSVFEKGRKGASGPRRSSAAPILINSNLSLQEFGNLARVEIDDAHHSRMIAVPLPRGGYGVFENLHGSTSGAQFSGRLQKIAKGNFGHASTRLLKKLTAENARDPDRLRRWLEERRESFLRNVEDITSPTQNLDRTKAKFATIYASGRFAIEHGILAWKVRDLRQSLRSCLLDHVVLVSREAQATHAGGNTSQSNYYGAARCTPLVQLREYVRANRQSVLDLSVEGGSDHLPHDDLGDCVVKTHHQKNGPEYLFTDEVLLMILGEKSRVQQLKLYLSKAGHIAMEKGSGGDVRYSVKRTISHLGRVQVIAIKAAAIDADT